MMMIRETFPIMRVNILATKKKKKQAKIEKIQGEKARESELPNQRNSQTFNQEKEISRFLRSKTTNQPIKNYLRNQFPYF